MHHDFDRGAADLLVLRSIEEFNQVCEAAGSDGVVILTQSSIPDPLTQ
jgi:hypothetical protein